MGAKWGNAVLAGLRSFVLLVALAVVGLGVWVEYIMHDTSVRGEGLLNLVPMTTQRQEAWRTLFSALTNSQSRIWIAIAAGGFTFLGSLLVFLSFKVQHFKMSRAVSIPLELLCMLAMAAAFVAPLTLAMRIMQPCANMPKSSSKDLQAFGMVCPLVTGYTVAGGVGWFTLAITSLSAIVSACRHRQDNRQCSFEPTASGLGMSDHAYQATSPDKPLSHVPTMYDPRKPDPLARTNTMSTTSDEEKGLAGAGAPMGMGVARSYTNASARSKGSEGREAEERDTNGGISGPLGLQKPEVAANARPAHRPWSEMPKREG